MIYTAPWAMLLMWAASIARTIGRGLCPGNRDFLGPVKLHRADRRVTSGGPKRSRFPGPNPLPLALVMDAARIKSITHGAVLIISAQITSKAVRTGPYKS